MCGQRGQVNGSILGYKDPPVPRRLVDSRTYQRILPPGHPIPPVPLSGIGLGGEPTKIRVGTQAGFRICGLPIQPLSQTGKTDPEPLGVDSPEGAVYHGQFNVSSQDLHVPNRPTYSNRKAGTTGETPHETHSVAPQKTLEGSGVSGKRNSSSKVPSPSPSVWTKETNVLLGQPLHPLHHAIQIFTDASKEGWGAHLGDFTARGIWSVPESHLHINFLELKAVLLALKRFQHLVQGKVVLVTTDNTTVVAYINKEGGMRSGSLCALLWRLLCSCNLRQVVLKARHIPGRLNVIADKLSRQGQVEDLLVQTWHRPQVDMFATKYKCKLAQYVSPVPDPSAWAVDALTVSWESLDMYVFPPVSLPSLQESDPNSSGLAQHAMVLGPGGTVVSDSSLPTQPSRPSDTAIQQGASQESDQSKPPHLAPRAQAFKEQGFSSPVASRIEAPQRSSTRTVYEAKWSVFVRWCESSQVDFRSPSVKQIADFLLHLFQVKNLQPSTIDGYRSAIADKLGNLSLNVSKDENLTRLLDSFHRDRPKGRRGIPSWNLSLVLHQLTKPPFEPLRKASLKHLTFKTVFLLAMGSGKRRSEIHAWLNKNIRHQADWSKVSLYPSPSFLAKNHLEKEGPECVAPVVIPALAPTLDKSLKEDRSLCPVRALRYYLDKLKISDKEKSWCLSPSKRVSRRIFLLLRSRHGLSRRLSFAMNYQIKKR